MSLLSVSSPGTAAIVSVVVFLWLIYRALLPRPIPGIPYNKEATRSILGDTQRMMEYSKKHLEVFGFLTDQCRKHQSPVVQVFIRPLGKASIIVTDFREAYDVVTRRSKDFDRSQFLGDIVGAVVPKHHVGMPSNEIWRKQRRLLSDTMSPAFLDNVRLYSALWICTC